MSHVEYRSNGAIAHLVLNRPKKRNALSAEMLTDIGHALDKFHEDEANVLVVRGEGSSFCAGVDVSSGSRYANAGAAVDHERLEGMAALWLRFWDSPKPVIAQVHGHCVGAALHLVLSCDLVVVSDDAVLGAPKLPMGAGWIGPELALRIGVQRAKLFTFQIGYEMSGLEAFDAGLATVVTNASDLAEQTEALAHSIARMPSDLLRIEKQAINAVAEHAGFRTATANGTLWDALSHTSKGVAAAKALVRSEGISSAVQHYSTNWSQPKGT